MVSEAALAPERAGQAQSGLTRHVIVIGGGPAGLMAADVVSARGIKVTVIDRMPSLGRKLLIAGRGGLNLTHSEALEPFLARFGAAGAWLAPMIRTFPPSDLVAFAHALGQETFVGSSGRVFPKSMKASPLLRAWLARLVRQGVTFVARQRLVEVTPDGAAVLRDDAGGETTTHANAVVLALGGASWARLGSDGSWVSIVERWGVGVAPMVPTNCGVSIAWSEHLKHCFAGTPLKRIALTIEGHPPVRGEALMTTTGLEGGAIYSLSRVIRERLDAGGNIELRLDLRPDMTPERVADRLAKGPGKQSFANWLRKSLSMAPVEIALLREAVMPLKMPAVSDYPRLFPPLIKSLPITITGLSPIDRAISSAGGIRAGAFGPDLQLKRRPGVFVAGEMLDWEAPTGGYLLQACFATGYAAGQGVLSYLGQVETAGGTSANPG